MMLLPVKIFSYILIGGYLLNVAGPCNCNKRDCNNQVRGTTAPIQFGIRSAATGNSLLMHTTRGLLAPDSIRLKDLRTGLFYPLLTGLSPQGPTLYSAAYLRPAGVMDSLALFFGNSTPDTLFIQTGMVDAFKGDECGIVKDAGITRVTLRGQILLNTTTEDALFMIPK